ncbi:MAG: zinc-ribbon domain-containing protein [Proteobacteria bacterium]|nr:zinc-ribbon domain-containing protein [Pseudomonadota bacterium]MBU1596394.1 zinc-ribbon domain-containing protein [Pseudomonadota bacterium]
MIVACPNCASKYNLPEDKIAPTGSKVRCAKCQHVFTAMPPGKDFDAELEGLRAAEVPATPPAPAPKAPAQKMPWDDEPAAEPAAAPAADAAKKMPWDDDEPAAAPSAAPAAAAKKMPWDDDEPAAGPVDDDDAAPAPAGSGGAFDDEPAAAPARAASPEKAEAKDDDFLNALGSGDRYALDKEPAAGSKKRMLILGAVLALLALCGAGLFIFKPWTKMNIPFLSALSSTPKKAADNAEKVKDIALRNVRQYYIPNEKAGQIFVIEGKAVNNFPTPKERIKVEMTLFDEKGKVLASKQMLCGNTLSQFQLQVQSEEEINSSLASEVGILTSNTYLKTGMDTPFMAVFFKPSEQVKEFGVKVIDAQDPK